MDNISCGGIQINFGDALDYYPTWERPTVIISDGAYGLGLFPSDPTSYESLPLWYEPHVKSWSQYALPSTTLWFWCNEIGWATIHPLLHQHGWRYRALHVWDKGVGHIAGNVNGQTIRRFPVVTEVCVQYTRELLLPTGEGQLIPVQMWLRHEWLRTGLPLTLTNDVCGVANAATRKYFTLCHRWYFPPSEMMERLVKFANKHGRTTSQPYFVVSGTQPVTGEEWSRLRPKWNHQHGITNVWSSPAVRGSERVKVNGGKSLHANQKPLSLMNLNIISSSDLDDVVWEPFGGLCSAAVAALRTGRRCYAAECDASFYIAAKQRLQTECKDRGPSNG